MSSKHTPPQKNKNNEITVVGDFSLPTRQIFRCLSFSFHQHSTCPSFASKTVGEIIPELKGKLEGLAMRVPTPNVSLVDLVFNSQNKLSVKKINDSFIKASNKELKNVLDTTNERLVSVDFNHNPNSAIVDLSLTSVVGDNMGKVSAWYDNEWGFASRMNDLVEYIHKV